MSSFKGVAFIFSAGGLWALDSLIRFPLINQGYHPYAIVMLGHMYLMPFALYVIVQKLDRIKKYDYSVVLSLIFIGGIGSGLSTLAYTKAFAHINISIVILLQKLQPFLAISLARLWLKEPISKQFLWWALIAFIGGICLSFDDLKNLEWAHISQFSGHILKGYLLALLAVGGWGASTVCGKYLTRRKLGVDEIMAGRFFFAFVLLGSMYPFYTSVSLTGSVLMMKVLIMALLAGIASLFLYYQGLKRVSAKLSALAEMSFPFFAVILNWTILGAELNWLQLLGGALLLCGATVVQFKKY